MTLSNIWDFYFEWCLHYFTLNIIKGFPLPFFILLKQEFVIQGPGQATIHYISIAQSGNFSGQHFDPRL